MPGNNEGEKTITKIMRLEQRADGFYINNLRSFSQTEMGQSVIDECFSFAYAMVFGDGHHRTHRSGGQMSRTNGELFANTFQGKMAEFAVHEELVKNGISGLTKPDMSIYGEGVWDDADLDFKGIKINIKSAAFFSNLLLLEAKDWNEQGQYMPNLIGGACYNYDYFILVRMKPDIKNVLRSKGIFNTVKIRKKELETLIKGEKWFYDIAGVCSQKTIKHIVENEYLIRQNSFLNGKVRMDADNYYIQSGSLKCISELITELAKL